MMYYCLRFPKARFHLVGDVEPVTARVVAITWFLVDFALLGEITGVSHGVHLGGFTFGAISFLVHTFLIPRIWNLIWPSI
jgi:membrane associated rhomboid family serine protease